jgi:hypothetical protein
MEASAWKSMTDLNPATLNEEELNAICDRVCDDNRQLCRPRPDHVEDNPGRRTMSKLRVNALWGKYVQSDHSRHRLYLDSLTEYLEIIQSPKVRRDSVEFRQIYGDMFECRYETLQDEWERAHNINPYLAASVTGWARVLLHKKIREAGVAYCDTDSVVYLHKPGVHPERWDDERSGIGCWGDELETGLKGELFMALAPKCYCLVYDRPNSKGEMYVVKSKGVTMAHENHALINPDTYETMLIQAAVVYENGPITDPTTASARTWRILINHIHKVLQHLAIITETGWKNVRPVFNKRELLQLYVVSGMPDISAMDLIMTVSHGYVHAKEPRIDPQDIFYPGITATRS